MNREIGGETVTIRGAIVNGVPKLGTALIPEKFPGWQRLQYAPEKISKSQRKLAMITLERATTRRLLPCLLQ